MNELLKQIRNAIRIMGDLEGQDDGMVIEMSEQMLTDVIETGVLDLPLVYVKRYCTVIDSSSETHQLADKLFL